MSYTRTHLYTFTCDDCPQQHDILAADHHAAEHLLRRAGWAAHHAKHRCPQHRVTGREAADLGRRAWSAIRAGRVEDYAELRSWGLTRQQAADRLGVCLKTAERYDADLRQRRQVAA